MISVGIDFAISIGDEPLEEWRGWYRERYESILDSALSKGRMW